MSKLRVGYILDDVAQSSFIHDLITRGRSAEHYSIELLIVQKAALSSTQGALSRFREFLRKRGLKRTLDRMGFALIERLEKAVVLRIPRFAQYYRRYPLEDLAIETLYVTPQISPSGFVYKYSEEDVAQIAAKNLDVLVRGGNGILRGKVLDVCRFGILSFHHADNVVNRGGPVGFWEVFRREPSTGFVIQRLKSELDGGDVLYKGSIATARFFLLNQIKLYVKANIFLHRLLERAGREGRLPDRHPDVPYAYSLYRLPTLGRQVRYVTQTYFQLSKKFTRKLAHRDFRWGVAYQFVDDWKSAVLWRSKVIRNPPNHFLADPFVVRRNGKYVCYVEDFSYAEEKGSISAYEISREGYRELGKAIDESFHMSYPFVFEADGELYMCPETSQAKDIRLYKCTEFPLGWTLHKVLLNDVRAVDTSIFRANDRWWMLANIDSSEAGDSGSELHVYYADRFDSDRWTSHPKNPVVFDAKRARNGGFVQEGNALYRVFQVPGFNVYGAAMGVVRISELTTEDYKEELLFTLPPEFFSGLKGTHTYSFADGLLALDFVKIENVRK